MEYYFVKMRVAQSYEAGRAKISDGLVFITVTSVSASDIIYFINKCSSQQLLSVNKTFNKKFIPAKLDNGPACEG